jgi:hypothetical protein
MATTLEQQPEPDEQGLSSKTVAADLGALSVASDGVERDRLVSDFHRNLDDQLEGTTYGRPKDLAAGIWNYPVVRHTAESMLSGGCFWISGKAFALMFPEIGVFVHVFELGVLSMILALLAIKLLRIIGRETLRGGGA